MADLYLEYDYLPKKKQRRRALRKRPRWPFVLLGFFIGFITLPAVIAGAVFLFVNRPVEKTVNTIDKATNAGLYEALFGKDDKVGILDDRYGEMALKDALGDIIKIAEKGGKLTFQDLATISPKVEESVEELITTAEEKSIILNKEELMTTPLNNFGDLLMDEVKEIELGEVLLSTKSDIFNDDSTGAILKNLFFGKLGVNYTENEGVITMLPISYTYDDNTNTFTCVDETVYTYNGSIWVADNGQHIVLTANGYDLYDTAANTVLYHLQSGIEKSSTTYIAVMEDENGALKLIKQKSLALGDFMDKGSNPMDIIGKLELGTLLGITTQKQAEDDDNAMLVALAYGTKGIDFTYENGNIVATGTGKPFTTLSDLMETPDEVLNTLQLGSLLGITTKEQAENKDNAMLVALAYGTKGVDFEYDTNGNIVPLNGKKFTTLGQLTQKPDEVLNGIQLGSLLGITTPEQADDKDNAMLVALAYGTKGVDFTYENGAIVPLNGKKFTTLGQLTQNPDEVLNGIQLGSLLGITTQEQAENKDNAMLVALAYGTKGVDFTYENGAIVPLNGKEFTTLGQLTQKPDEVLNGIQLGSLLGITTPEQADDKDNAMLVALAYGTKGVDFTYENGAIVPLNGKEFTTLGQLTQNPDEVLNGIQLGSLLGITTQEQAENKDNAMLVALAYGTKGVDFTYENGAIVPLNGKKFTTLGQLTQNPDEVLNGIQLGSLLGITTQEQAENKDNAMLVALAYGTKGVDFTYENGAIVPLNGKKFTTLGQLTEKPDEVLNGIQLGSLLGITTQEQAENKDNAMLVALAYGTKGVDFEYDANGNIVAKAGGKPFTTLGQLTEKPDELLNGIRLGTLLGINTQTDVDSGENDMMVALAYGTYGVDFGYDTNGNIIAIEGGKPFTTLGDLINTPNDVLQTLQLGSLLGITTKDHVEGNEEKNIKAADELIVVLAYGTYDVDFVYDDSGKIIPKAGGTPFTTVKMLMDSGEAEEIFKNIPLSSIFAVDVFDPNADSLTVSLVYGTEGKHYELIYPVDGEPCDCGETNPHMHWLPNTETADPDDVYSERTFGELRDGDLTKFVEDLKVSDVFTIVESGEDASPKLLIAIKDWKISELSNPDSIKGLQLQQVIDIDPNDSFLSAISTWAIGEIGEEKIKTLRLNQVLDIADNDTFLKAIGEWEIGEIGQNKIKGLQIKDFIDVSGSDSFLKAIGEWKIGEIGQDKIKELQLKDVMPIDEDDGFLSAMGEWKIGEINDEKIKGIKLSNVLSVEDGDTGLLATLIGKDWAISDLTEANIQSLKLKEVLPGAIGTGDNDFFSALADTPLSQLNAAYIQNTLTIGQALGISESSESEYGILYQFRNTKIKDFNESLLKSTLTIGDVVDTDHPVLNVLKDKHLNEINEDLIQSELEKLKLSQIIELEDGEKLHPIFQTLQDKTIGDITKGNIIDTLTVGHAIGLTKSDLGDDDAILKQIIDVKLGELKNSNTLKDKINDLQLSAFIGTAAEDGIFKEMSGWKIGDITESKVNGITLATIFNVESGDTGLLATLANKKDAQGNAWTIAHLTSDNINALTLSEVLGASQVDGNFYLKHLSGSTLGSLSTDIQNISVLDLFSDTMEYETDGSGNIIKDENGHPVIKGTWKYLLKWNWDETKPDAPNKNYVAPENYKVSDMAAMIENMHNNIEVATLQDLHKDDMMPHLGTDTLEMPLMYQIRMNGLVVYDFSDAVKTLLGNSYEIKDENGDGKLDDKSIGNLNVLDVANYLTILLGALEHITTGA